MILPSEVRVTSLETHVGVVVLLVMTDSINILQIWPSHSFLLVVGDATDHASCKWWFLSQRPTLLFGSHTSLGTTKSLLLNHLLLIVLLLGQLLLLEEHLILLFIQLCILCIYIQVLMN